MKLLKKLVHNDLDTVHGKVFNRVTARGIVLKGSKIMLLYTKVYNDYSFPGGGVDPNEDIIRGLKRELAEETGATNIRIIDEYGKVEEYRPHYNDEYDLVHMQSYFYICELEENFSNANFEDYEIANGMSPVWIDIHEAIAHNNQVLANKDKTMGFSIYRETLVLEMIARDLFPIN